MENETIDEFDFDEIGLTKGNPIHLLALGIFLYLIIQNLASLFVQFLSDIVINAGTYSLNNMMIISFLKLIFILIVLIYLKNKIKKNLIIKKKYPVSIFRMLIILLIVSYLLQTGYTIISPLLFLQEVSEIGGFGKYNYNLSIYNRWIMVADSIITIVIYAVVLMTDKEFIKSKIQ